MKHRTVSLRQLSFLLLIVEMLAGCILMTEQLTNESQIRSQFSNWLWLEDISNPMPKNFHSPSGKFSLVARQLSDDLMQALHKVITNVWSTGRVPAEWKEGIIVSLYKGKARSLSAVVTGRFLFCQYREKYLHISFWRAFSLYLTSDADLNSLVLLPGGLLWMPY